MAAFLMAVFFAGMDEQEVDALTAYLCRPIDPSVSTGCQVPSAAKK